MRREKSSNGMDNRYNIGYSMNNNKHESSSWRSFQPVMVGQSTFHGRQPPPHLVQSPPPMDRAEPDGVEDDKDSQGTVAKSLEGDYDHSKEYDPFKTAERQMQELLFGTPTATKPTPRYGSPDATHQSVQKPQPVRPGPSNPNPYSLKPTSPPRGHPHIKPAQQNLIQRGPARTCESPENEKKSNWRQFLPALLSRQQTNQTRKQTNKAHQQTNNNSRLTASSTNKQTSPGLARYCQIILVVKII